MSSSSRDKLNTIWFWIALVVALFAGGLFSSFFVTVIVFVAIFALLVNNRDVRLNLRNDRPHNGRSR